MSSSLRIMAVLLDVGGTLWPDHPPPEPSARAVERLVRAVPELTLPEAERLREALREPFAQMEQSLTQDTWATIRAAGQAQGYHWGPTEAEAVRRALCRPAAGHWSLFPGAEALVQAIGGLGLKSALLSNGIVRAGADYWHDFAGFGLAAYLDAVVCSVDLGIRKPDPAIFKAACEAVGAPAPECVMIGNSEWNDIAPAIAMGMKTIRVGIEEPPPIHTSAHAVAYSLTEVQQILTDWVVVSTRS